jgi:hypothetical protein
MLPVRDVLSARRRAPLRPLSASFRLMVWLAAETGGTLRQVFVERLTLGSG